MTAAAVRSFRQGRCKNKNFARGGSRAGTSRESSAALEWHTIRALQRRHDGRIPSGVQMVSSVTSDTVCNERRGGSSRAILLRCLRYRYLGRRCLPVLLPNRRSNFLCRHNRQNVAAAAYRRVAGASTTTLWRIARKPKGRVARCRTREGSRHQNHCKHGCSSSVGMESNDYVTEPKAGQQTPQS